MALSANVIWECNSVSGSDTAAGGGFDATVPNAGINQSLGGVVTLGSLTINASNSAQVSNVGGSQFTPGFIGNVLFIPTGVTGFTSGYYLILNVVSGLATVDRSLGTPGQTGGSGYVGGAILSPAVVAGAMVPGNVCYIKNTGTTYNITGPANNVANGQVNPPAGVSLTQPTAFIGYQNNRTFMNTDPSPTIFINTNSTTAFNLTNSINIIRNITFTTAGTSNYAVHSTGACGYHLVENCTVLFSAHTGGHGIVFDASLGYEYAINCYVNGCAILGLGVTLAAVPAPPVGSTAFLGCVGDSNGTAGSGNSWSNFLVGSGMIVAYCISCNGGASGFDAYANVPSGTVIFQCSTYNNTDATFGFGYVWGTGITYLINCLAFGDSISGFKDNGNATPSYINRYLAIGGSIANPTIVVSTANLFNAVTVTVNPYANATGKDFSLNNTATGGAACRGVGYPSSYVGINTSNFPDIGASEHTQVIPGRCVMAVQDATYQNPVFSEPGRVVITGRGGVFGATPRRTIIEVDSSTGVASSTTANMNLPGLAGVQGQDLLLVFITSRTTDHTPVTVVDNNPGGGWVKFFEFSTLAGGPNSITLSGFYAFNTPSTKPNFTSSPVTGINGFSQSGIMVAFRNVDPSQPIDVISSGVNSIGASANSVVSPSVTTIIDQDQLLVAAGDWDGGTITSTINGIGGLTGPPGVQAFKRIALVSPPGATGTINVSDSFGTGDPKQILQAITFALRPAPFINIPFYLTGFTQIPEKLATVEPESGSAFSASGKVPTTNKPYISAVVAAQVSPPQPEPGFTRSTIAPTPPPNVVPRVFVSGFQGITDTEYRSNLLQGTATSTSAFTSPRVMHRPPSIPSSQTIPPMVPEPGAAIIGQVFPPVPLVPTPPPVLAAQVVPPSFPEGGVSYIYPAWQNKVPPYPNLYRAGIVEIPTVDREGGRVFIGQVFPPVPTVKTPPPVTAKQEVPPFAPEPGGQWIYPFGTELPPVPLQMPIRAVIASQEYPHNQVEPGRSIIGQVFPPVPQVPYRAAVVAYATTPPQYNQGSAFTAPNPDIVPSVSSKFPYVPPAVYASQVSPPFVPEDRKAQAVSGVVPAFYRPAQPVTAVQSDRELQQLLSQGQSQFLGYGVVGTPSQLYGKALVVSQTTPPFEPESGSAFTGGTSLIPQPPASPPPGAIIAIQAAPPPSMFPEEGRRFENTRFPPPPFVSPFYATPATRVEPPFMPEPGRAFVFSQAFRFYPFQFSIKATQETPPPGVFPESGRVYIGAVVPPVPPVPTPPPVVASQVLPIPAALPEPGRAIFVGVVLSGPLHPMWRPAQIVSQQTPTQGTFPEGGRASIGAVVPPVPQVKTPPPVSPAVQVAPPLVPEDGRAFIWKTPPQGPPSPPPRPQYGFIVKPDFTPEPGSATSAHAYAPTPIMAPGFATYPQTRTEPPFEPEPGSAFCASAGPFVPAPIIPTPPPVVASQVVPQFEPEPGYALTFYIDAAPPITTPGRVIALVDTYAPKIKTFGVVGGS